MPIVAEPPAIAQPSVSAASQTQPPVSPSEPPIEIVEKPVSVSVDTAAETLSTPENQDTIAATAVRSSVNAQEADNEWHKLLSELQLTGMALQLAEHCLIRQCTDTKLVLLLEASGGTLKTRSTEASLQSAVDQYFGHAMTLEFEVLEMIAETPAQRRVRHREERQQQAELSIEQDPFVQQLQQQFGGTVLPGSVKPNMAGE